MLKLSKKVDYGLILLSGMAKHKQASSARDMAESFNLPLPMVANILKALTASEILASTRGAQGGYVLNREAERISLADVVESLEGPVYLVDCVDEADDCKLSDCCPNHSHIQAVQLKFHEFLRELTLSELMGVPKRPIILENDANENAYLPR